MNTNRMLSLSLLSCVSLALTLACRSEKNGSESAVKQDMFANPSMPGNEMCNRPSVRVEPSAITSEGTAVFSWNLPGYRSVRNDQGLFFEERGPSGSVLVRGGTTRMLRLIATPLGAGPDAVFELPFRVEAVGGESRIYSFTSTKPNVGVNEVTSLRWIVGGCSSLEIRGPGGWTHGAPCRPFEDSVSVAIPESGTYSLTLKDGFQNPVGTAIYRLEVR